VQEGDADKTAMHSHKKIKKGYADNQSKAVAGKDGVFHDSSS